MHSIVPSLGYPLRQTLQTINTHRTHPVRMRTTVFDLHRTLHGIAATDSSLHAFCEGLCAIAVIDGSNHAAPHLDALVELQRRPRAQPLNVSWVSTSSRCHFDLLRRFELNGAAVRPRQ